AAGRLRIPRGAGVAAHAGAHAGRVAARRDRLVPRRPGLRAGRRARLLPPRRLQGPGRARAGAPRCPRVAARLAGARPRRGRARAPRRPGARADASVMLARLWRRRRRLRVSREGKYFIVITLGVGLAALNTGNNLLFLLLGWMCSVIVASGVLSEHSLRGLAVARQQPARIHAGRPFLMGISLKNAKSRLPSLSIEIEDLVVAEPEGHRKAARPLDKKCYFLKIPAGRTQSTSYRHTFSRRGLYRFAGFRVSTKFPFALFRKSRDV